MPGGLAAGKAGIGAGTVVTCQCTATEVASTASNNLHIEVHAIRSKMTSDLVNVAAKCGFDDQNADPDAQGWNGSPATAPDITGTVDYSATNTYISVDNGLSVDGGLSVQGGLSIHDDAVFGLSGSQPELMEDD